MISQQNWLLSELLIFYQNKEYLEIVKKIVNREFTVSSSKNENHSVPSLKNENHSNKKVSIRIVNWFVTNYAKQHFTVYENEGERFFVWTRFRSAEDGYSKEMFDPYCRKDRIIIPYDETTQIVTTIGQLNFFKWAIMNKVVDYIVANYDDITKDMNLRLTQKNKHSITVDSLSSISTDESTTTTNNNNNTKTRKKREELSVSACLSIRKEFVPIKITF
jgi:hypothetical protein